MPRARASHPMVDLLPVGVEGFEALSDLALDLRWSWNHATDGVWRRLDAALWEMTENPWVVLQTVSRERIERAWSDPAFRREVEGLVEERRRARSMPDWLERNPARGSLTGVAYFCMEFMVNESLPIYSGGLGNVAGDLLKAGDDVGLPLFGVGLLYQQGYFRQVIARDGSQRALFPYNDPGSLPVTPVREKSGEWLRVEIPLPGGPVWARAWQARVGRLELYLLDSNDPANLPARRGITSELYGGGPDLRLEQELLLGIGGWRLLRALGLRPEVCHLNEGHAAFAVLERARDFMADTGRPFDAALAATRAGNLFTTHTAVAAGFDRFAPGLVTEYLGDYATGDLKIPLRDLLALGRANPDDPAEPFNMAYLAIRGSGAVNGVSRLHGQVSRRLFEPLFPRWPVDEVPVGHVTNGVHVRSWDSALADELWTGACGRERWLRPPEDLEREFRRIPDAALWQHRQRARRSLVEYARGRLARELAGSGAPPAAVEEARRILDPDALTLGFARRFATYKRPDLLLRDPARLLRLMNDPRRPVQVLVAGKAHPDDEPGQAMILEWTRFVRRPEARFHAVFLADYDVRLTEQLVQGVDVWINTPRRPWEACGTSGMKVLVNGGLNLSELDGWWAEAYAPEVGWAIGDGREHGEDPAWDAAEAGALYDLLEREIVPAYYDRGPDGVPAGWVARIRESMARLTPRFSAVRMLREYAERHYLPAAQAYRARAADRGAEAARIADGERDLERRWSGLRFGGMRVETAVGRHVFTVELDLGGMDADAVRVELYADGLDGGPPVRQEMTRVDAAPGRRAWRAEVPARRDAGDYTARAMPRRPGVSVPLESGRILWQR